MVHLRQPLPPYLLRTPEGQKVYLPDLKGRTLVLLRDLPLAQALAAHKEALEALEAQAFLLAPTPQASPLPLLLDPEGQLLGAIPSGGALVADAHLEVYYLGPARDAEVVLEWTRFVAFQCPECLLPEEEWF
jgi:hypothetical protein